jgi:O-antigen ligase
LGQGDPVFKGQSAAIVLFFVVFGLAFLFWLGIKNRVKASGLLSGFLILMSIAWFAHLFLYRIHGDAFNYTALLYVPILAMIWLKPPTLQEAWNAIFAFAWTVAVVLVLTRVLEMLGVLALKSQSQNIITFDEERYFLPLNDVLGIDGRWPGPFGHNGDTAMMGALLIVIAVAYWTRASWVFLFVGVFTLLVTSGRASMGATIAGIIILVIFAKAGRISQIPQAIRIWGGLAALAVGAVFMYSRSAGVTGRDNFWPAFLKLWESSPWVGIGTSGISVSGGITQEYGHAHNLYIDELARYGLLGFITQFGAITLGVVIAFLAAKRGVSGPLAILTAYLVTGVTEPRNQWMSPSVTGVLLVLAVVTAGSKLNRTKETESVRTRNRLP